MIFEAWDSYSLYGTRSHAGTQLAFENIGTTACWARRSSLMRHYQGSHELHVRAWRIRPSPVRGAHRRQLREAATNDESGS